MPKLFFSFCLLLMLSACNKTINDTKDACTGDCTKMKGKIVTHNGQPVPGVFITFAHVTKYGGNFFSTTRKIRNATTGADGSFDLSFYLLDTEIGQGTEGYFTFEIDRNSIDQKKYIIDSRYNPELYMGRLLSRDTTLNVEYYLPQKATIKVNLNGFQRVDSTDYFEVNTAYAGGFKQEQGNNNGLGTPYGIFYSPIGENSAKTAQFSTTLTVAKNDTTYISVLRKKNGQPLTTEQTKIVATANNNIVLTYNY